MSSGNSGAWVTGTKVHSAQEGSCYSREPHLLVEAAPGRCRPTGAHVQGGSRTLPHWRPIGTVPMDGTDVINSQYLFLAFSTAHEVSYRARHILLF